VEPQVANSLIRLIKITRRGQDELFQAFNLWNYVQYPQNTFPAKETTKPNNSLTFYFEDPEGKEDIETYYDGSSRIGDIKTIWRSFVQYTKQLKRCSLCTLDTHQKLDEEQGSLGFQQTPAEASKLFERVHACVTTQTMVVRCRTYPFRVYPWFYGRSLVRCSIHPFRVFPCFYERTQKYTKWVEHKG
jgi:hypothetical protein